MKKSRVLIAGLAAIAAAATIGGTWAAWSQQLLAKNEYMTAKYSTFLEEKFEQPEGWQPGQEEEKAVWVQNDSTIPIIAKITMNQEWFRREDVKAWIPSQEGEGYEYATVSNGTLVRDEAGEIIEKGDPLDLIFDGDKGREYAAILNFNKDGVVVLAENRAQEPGLQLPGVETVDSLDQARGKWLLVSETPDEIGNYTFYYMGVVDPGKATPLLLESVRMNSQLEATVTQNHTYYEKDENAEDGYKKVTISTVNSEKGYDSSTYILRINMQTVQATKGAVEQILAKDKYTEYIAGYIANTDGGYESTSVKLLYFDEANGVMQYTPYRTEDGKHMEDPGNWFMSFVNMVPGGKYVDHLRIENGNWRAYNLYMRIVPRKGQTEVQDELLKKIAMKVYYKDKLIYDGDVTGYHFSDIEGRPDMQGLVPLGIYGMGTKEEIRVELELDPDLGLQDDGSYKYADVLTKVDWEFMVQEIVHTPGGDGGGGGGRRSTPIPDEPVPAGGLTEIGEGDVPLSFIPQEDVPLAALLPKTGDESRTLLYGMMAVISLMILAWALKELKKES